MVKQVELSGEISGTTNNYSMFIVDSSNNVGDLLY